MAGPFAPRPISPFDVLGSGLPTLDVSGVVPMEERRYANPPGTMVGRALGRGFNVIGQNLGSAAEGLGNVTGVQALSDFGAETVRQNQVAIDRSRAMESDGPLSYVVGLLGENAPQLIASMIPFVRVAGVGLRTAQAAAVSGGFNYAMLAGEARETQRAELARQGSDAPINEAAAFGAAVPAALLETLAGGVQARLAARVLEPRTVGEPFLSRATAGRIAGAAARGAATEAPTEVGQQAIMRAQAGQSLTDAEAFAELAEAGLAGAILGGMISGGARTVGALRDRVVRSPEPAATEQAIQMLDQQLQIGQAPPMLALPPPDTPSEALTPSPQIEPRPERPLQGVPTENLITGLMAAERRVAEVNTADGRFGGTPADAQEAIQTMRAIRAEIATREQEQELPPGALLAPARGEQMVTPGMQQAETARQPFLFDEMSPEGQARTAQEQRQILDTRRMARDMGLGSGKFAQSLRARNRDELFDEVLDAAQRIRDDNMRPSDGNLGSSATFARLLQRIGVGRDFEAEIQAQRLERDKLRDDPAAFQAAQREVARIESERDAYAAAVERFNARRQAEVERGVAAMEAEQAAAAARAREADLAARRQRAIEAEAAYEQREQQRLAEQQRNTVLRDKLGEALAFKAREQSRAQEQAEAIPQQQREVVQSALVRQATQQEAQAQTDRLLGEKQIEAQRLIEQAPMLPENRKARNRFQGARARNALEQAAIIAKAPDTLPVDGPIRVADVYQRGTAAELRLTNGAEVRLTQRKGKWYDGDAIVGRNLDEAMRTIAIRAERSRDGGWDGTNFSAVRVQEGLGVREPVAGMSPGAQAMLAVKRDRAARMVAKAVEGWKGPYPARLYDAADMPPQWSPELREKALKGGGMIDANGVVYINAAFAQSPEAAKSIYYHEVLGHLGMRRAFGDARAELLERVYDTNAAFREEYAIWRSRLPPGAYERFYADKPLWSQYEEVLAVMSEGGPIKASFLDKFAKLVRDFARRMGMNLGFSDREVKLILAEAHARAMEPGSPETQPAVQGGLQPPRWPSGPAATPQQVQAAARTYGDVSMSAGMLTAAARATSGLPQSQKGAETALGRIIRVAQAGKDKLMDTERSEGMRSARMYFQTLNHLVQQYGRIFQDGTKNYLKSFQTARDLRASLREIASRMGTQDLDSYAKLAPAEQADTRLLMSGTFYQLDPKKPLDAHDHLSVAQRTALAPTYRQMQEAMNRLQRTGAMKVYDRMRNTLDAAYFQQHAMDLYTAVKANRDVQARVPSAGRNPLLDFMDRHADQADPAKVRAFWSNRLDALLAETRRFLTEQGRVQPPAAERARIETIMTTLTDTITSIERNQAAMQTYPYFHLGRFGRYSAEFVVRGITGPDGRTIADPRATEIIAEELAKLGLDNVVVNEFANGPKVFLRTDSRTTANDVVQLAKRLAQRGLVDSTKPIQYDEVDPVSELNESARRSLDLTLRELETMHSPVDSDTEEVRAAKQRYVERVKADMRQAYLNRLPDRSIAKVMTRRGFRAGFDADMVRSHAQRLEAGANAAAQRLYSDLSGEALGGMNEMARAASQGDPNKWAMNSVIREIMQREEVAPPSAASGFVDGMRALNHNYFLAWNPGYWLTQITQLPTNVVPELMKSGAGFLESSQALMRNMPLAMRIVSAALQDAKARGFAQYGADATVTPDILQRVKLLEDPKADAELKAFLNQMFNKGVIDIGSASRELGRQAEGKASGAFDQTMRWASSSSYYLEVLTRLNTALAARDIAAKQGKDPEATLDYAVTVVREGMLDYTESNRARAFSRKGLANEYTPLATAFLSFPFMMLEKYTREIGTAFGANSANPEERRAARRWLGGHLAAMGTLAGSLGLPFVTVIARAVDAVVDLLSDDEEPFNAQIAYRNFLADIFGRDVGEVLSRGLPRAVGFDISGRVGAADIIPFSRLIADRREWDDALKDVAFDTFGSSLSMVSGMLNGATSIMRGNVLQGMQQALPLGLRNPVSAFRMTNEGITDSRGNLLPLEPTAVDIAWQFVGLTPARRAEYSEANFAQTGRTAAVGREATRVRRAVASAIQQGDREALREALARVREFDQNVDPSMRIAPGLVSSVQQTLARREQAMQLGTTLNVRPQDFGAIRMGSFANY